MRSFAPFRLAAQLFLVAAILCLLAPFRAGWRMFALIPALGLVAAFPAVRCKNALGRAAIGLLPGLALLLASGLPSLIAGALMVAYIAVYLGLGSFSMQLWQYRQEALVLIVLSAVTAMLSNIAAFRGVPPRYLAVGCLCFVILALRALRISRSAAPSWELRQSGAFLVPILGGAALGGVIWLSLPLLSLLMQGVAALLGGVASLWTSFWSWLMGSVEIKDDFYETAPVPSPIITTEGAEATTDATLPRGSSLNLPKVQLPWGIILGVMAGICLLLWLIWLLRRGSKPTKTEKQREQLQWEDAPDLVQSVRTRKRAKRSPKTNRERLRGVYREYLAYLRAKGVRTGVSATTEEITEASSELLLRTDELLRGLYRRARYSSEEISDEDLRLAEKSLEELLAKENLR